MPSRKHKDGYPQSTAGSSLHKGHTRALRFVYPCSRPEFERPSSANRGAKTLMSICIHWSCPSKVRRPQNFATGFWTDDYRMRNREKGCAFSNQFISSDLFASQLDNPARNNHRNYEILMAKFSLVGQIWELKALKRGATV